MITMNKLIKRGFLFSVCVLAAAALGSCASDDAEPTTGSDNTAVQVTAMVANSELSLTRGADGLDTSTGFSLLTSANSSSKINIRVDNGSGSYTNYAYSLTGALAITAPATQPYFPAGVNSVNVYGWYPENGGSTTFTVQDNQQTDANYCLSDVMIAQPTTSTRALSGTPQTWNVTAAALTFTHIMSKVKVTLDPQAGVTITQVKLKNAKKTVALGTTGSPVVTAVTIGDASGDAGDITLLSGGSVTSASDAADKVLCGVFPAQSITGDFLEITASFGGQSNTITYSLSSAKAFASNQQYEITASVGVVQTDQTVDIGNWSAAGNSPLEISVGSLLDFGEITVQTSGSFTYAADGSAHYPSVLSVSYTSFGNTTTTTTLTSGTDYDVVYYTSDGSTTITNSSITAAGTYYLAVVGKGVYNGAKWKKAFTLANAISGTPAVGSYLYADGFCSATASSALRTSHGGRIVGVIFSLTTSNADQALGYTHGYAVALQDASTGATWSSQTSLEDPNVVDLSFPYQNTMAQAELIIRGDLNGRMNTANATYVGSANTEAFYAAKNYSVDVSGFANSGWFLPSIGQLWSMCDELGLMDESLIGNSTYSNWGSENRTYGVWYGSYTADKVRTKLNSYLTAAGNAGETYSYFSGGANYGSTNTAGSGTDITGNTGFASAQSVYYWSSSEWSASYAFGLSFGSGGGLHFERGNAKSNSFRVRPVLAF